MLSRLDSSSNVSPRNPAIIRGKQAPIPVPPGVEIIALGEHVDYWDQLGWKDQFSSPLFSARQQDYGRAFHLENVYTPEMIVCEKLRAICQQMPEYGPTVNRQRAGSARARDFIDITSLVTMMKVDLSTKENRELLGHVFAAKRVKLSLLREIDKYRDFHRTNYEAVAATTKPGITLKGFDFYVDFVLGLIRQLEPLGDE